MRLSTPFRLAVLATFFGLAAYSLPAQDQGSDDVAAAARKARAQQQSAAKPKKVITNDDIPSKNTEAPASNPDAPKTGVQVQKGAEQAAANAAEKDPKSEAYWRKRFKDLHDKLSESEKELDVLQRELEKGQVQYYSDPQKAMTQEYNRSDINEKTTKIDAKKKEIEAIKQQISDLEDELRKAGGDSGWAR